MNPVTIILAFVSVVAMGLLAQMALSERGRSTLAGVATYVVTWSIHAWAAFVPIAAGTLSQVMVLVLGTSRRLWAVGVAAFIEELTGTFIDPEEIATAPKGSSLAGAARAMSEQIGGRVLDILAPPGPLSADSGRQNAAATMNLTAELSVQGWWIAFLGELSTAGLIKSTGLLPLAVENAFGFGRLARLMLRTPVKKAIGEPLEIYYNRLYQFTQLTAAEAIDAWQKGLLDDAALLSVLTDRGYSYERSTLLMNRAQQDFSLGQARDLWRRGALEDEQLLGVVRRQGYGEVRAGLVADLLRGEKASSLLEEVADEARAVYRAGQLTDDELREFLVQAHYRPAEVDLVLVREQLALSTARALTESQILDAFSLGAIDDTDARGRLRKLHFADEDIDLLFTLHLRRLTAAQVLDAYVRGRITLDEARTRLRAFGYNDDDIGLLLDLRQQRLTEGQILDALRQGLIDEGTARERLGQLGFDDATVGILLSFQAKTLSPAEVQQALLRGILTEDEARARLRQLGYSAADTEAIIQLRFRLIGPGQVLDLLRANLLTLETARQRMIELGYPADSVDLLLAFDRKQLSPADILRALLRGIVTEDEARARLQDLGYSAADVELFIATRFRLFTVGQIEDAYIDGLLTRADALARLEAHGFSADDADTLLRILELKKGL